MHIGLFFTWGVSLKTWHDKGLLSREVKLYKHLVDKNIKITFFTWGDEDDIKIAEQHNLPFDIVPLYTKTKKEKYKILNLIKSLFIFSQLKNEIKNIDILKTNQMKGAWILALAGKPFILRCGFELYHFTCLDGSPLLKKIAIRWLSWFAYKRSDHICVATEEDRLFIQKYCRLPDHKFSIHPNWIDTERFKPLKIEEKSNHILFVGRLAEQKNIKSLIKAIAELDTKLDIAGQGALQEELEHYAKNHGAQVHFLGVYSNDDLPTLYNQYPVFVLPSLYEGNPKTLLEAMACGRAVLGARVHGIQSVIKDQKNWRTLWYRPQKLTPGNRNTDE